MNLPIVSIIIPVYNAADLLYKCLNSLKEQTYNFLEIVFIDDCSLDNSNDLLIQFKEELCFLKPDFKVKIFKHDINRGVAAARNTGLEEVTGEYIYYVDADDYLANDAIELLVNMAIETGADIVGANWILQFEHNGRVMVQPKPQSPMEAIVYMAKGILRWNLWLFMIKKDLYDDHNIRFIPGKNMGEDMMVIFKLLLHAKSISMIEKPIYYYSKSNNESLTKIYSKKHKEEVEINLKELNKYFTSEKGFNDWNNLFNYLKLNIKLPLIISNSIQQYQEWSSWFPEANSYSLKNDLISTRIKILQYMASKRQFWFVRLHYYLVIKIVYGIIYK